MNQPLDPQHLQRRASGMPPQSTGPGDWRIAIIAAGWHADIVGNAVTSAEAELARQGVADGHITRYAVPGAFEIPLHAQRLARSGRYDAIIACGLIVNGGIYRHEFVTTAVIDGLMQVQLHNDVPVFSAVLTPRDFHEHEAHQAFFQQHFLTKGTEVAQACLSTLHSLAALEGTATGA